MSRSITSRELPPAFSVPSPTVTTGTPRVFICRAATIGLRPKFDEKSEIMMIRAVFRDACCCRRLGLQEGPRRSTSPSLGLGFLAASSPSLGSDTDASKA